MPEEALPRLGVAGADWLVFMQVNGPEGHFKVLASGIFSIVFLTSDNNE